MIHIQKPSAIRELHLLDHLSRYFQDLQQKQQREEAADHHDSSHDFRYTMFEVLFGCNSKQPPSKGDEYRLEMLSKLVSLSVSFKAVSVLECAAIWIYNQVRNYVQSWRKKCKISLECFCQKLLQEKDRNIQLHDIFPLKIANISPQKQNFPGKRFPNSTFFPCMIMYLC